MSCRGASAGGKDPRATRPTADLRPTLAEALLREPTPTPLSKTDTKLSYYHQRRLCRRAGPSLCRLMLSDHLLPTQNQHLLQHNLCLKDLRPHPQSSPWKRGQPKSTQEMQSLDIRGTPAIQSCKTNRTSF